MKKSKIIFTIACLLLFHSCDANLTAPETDQVINEFIKNQNLPKPQPYRVTYSNYQENVTVFKLLFGEPFDCPSGCAYSAGIGLKLKNKIGWLYLSLSEMQLTERNSYDIDSTEIYLFSKSFWDNLEKADQWTFRYALLPLLVRDSDTPLDVLNRISQGLYSYIDSYLGELLLLNIKVITDRTILTLLANLPVFQGDAYLSVREKAQHLLDNL
jgi:hypothetical protein